MKPTKVIRFHEFGDPTEVLVLEEVAHGVLLEGQLRVKIECSPINPADINYVQGNYGIQPELPATPGMEACGVVIESDSEEVAVGEQVIFVERVGAWQQQVVCDTSAVFVVPRELKLEADQASMLKVNPLTALRLLEGFVGLKPGDYVIQNAANSSVGQCFIQVAKLLGLKTINLVRREGLDKFLTDLGADHVLLDDKSAVAKVRKICGDNLPKLASNAVGGESALRLMDALAECGTHITYGAMSMRSLKIPNKFLIFKRIHLQGLWVTKWLAEEDKSVVDAAYLRLAKWVSEGELIQAVDKVYPPEKITAAVEHAMQGKRSGKVLIKW